ncbi:MAG: hypothetical protein QM775_09980 [Pirellulales bacterium]
MIVGGQPDARSDIYQLGCSLYQMLTNKAPFPVDDLRGKLEAHMKATPAPIEKLNPKVPSELAKLVSYMMQKKPDMRYQQMSSIIEKLLPFMSQAEAQSQPAAPTRASAAYDAWLMNLMQQTGGMPMPQQAAPGPMMQPGPMHQQPGPQMMQPGFGGPQGYAPQPGFGPQPNPMQQAGPMAGMGPQAAGPNFGGPAQRPGPMQAGPMQGPGPMQGGPMQAGPNVGAAGGSSSMMAERIRRRKQAQLRNLIGLVVVLTIVGSAGFLFRDQLMALVGPKETAVVPEKKPVAPSPVPTATPKPSATAPAVVAPQFPKRDQIGAVGTDPMFDSPTAGKPLNLAHLPRGVQLVAAIRLADIVKHPEGEHLLDEKVAGSFGTWLKTTVPATTGVPNDKVDQLLVGILDGASTIR